MYTDYYDNVYHRTLPRLSYVDIRKIDMTRSERGIPITEGIIIL